MLLNWGRVRNDKTEVYLINHKTTNMQKKIKPKN